MTIIVQTRVLETILAEARRAYPREACGLLLGKAQAVTRALAACNVHPDPRTHFEINPQALIDAHRAERAGGPCVLGYYHSHPVGAPAPSATDAACAARDGRIWAIAAAGEIAFWRDGAAGFEPLSYTRSEG